MKKYFQITALVVLLFVLLAPTLSVAQSWWGAIHKQFPVQTDFFVIEFDVVPRDNNVARAHVTLSDTVPGNWGDNACLIRFVVPDDGSDGYVDARNGSSYEADEVFNYFEDESYHIRMEVDPASDFYSVFIKALPEGEEINVKDGASFRTDQAGVGQLQYINVTIPYSDEAGTDNPGAELKNIVIKNVDGEVLWEDPGTEYVPGADFSITMDAERDEWYNTLTGPTDGWIFLPYTAVGTGTMPEDNEDCSGLVWFSWDETYLYCYAEVTDDLINVNNGTTYDNDCLELKIDPDPFAGLTTGVAAVRLTAWGEDDAEAPDGVDNLVAGNELDVAWEPVEGEDYARKEVFTDDRYGYNLEFRLPFEVIVREEKYVDNTVGGIMGLAVNLHDNDEGARDVALRWASDMDDTVWNDPQKHGSVTFMEGNMVSLSTENAITGEDTNSVDYSIPAGVAVDTQPIQAPIEFELAQNYPNPFNPTTTIAYALPQAGAVVLKVFDLNGRHVATIVDNEIQQAGVHTVMFDASELSSGVYFYQLQTPTQSLARKMTLLR